MSAFLCSEPHINLLANFWAQGDLAKGRKAFKLLVAENLRSLSARYPGRDFLDEWKRDAKRYKFRSIPRIKDYTAQLATLIVKQCNCFDYQACETVDYETTEAAQLVRSIRDAAIAAGGDVAGPKYDAAPWGIHVDLILQ
jgi:hypothetical protein